MNNELSLKEKLLIKFKAFLTEIAIMIGGFIGCLFAAIMVPTILYFEFYILFVYVIPFADSLAKSNAVTALVSIVYLTIVLFFPIYLFSGKDEFGLQQYYKEKLSSKMNNSSQNKNRSNKGVHNSREQKDQNQEQKDQGKDQKDRGKQDQQKQQEQNRDQQGQNPQSHQQQGQMSQEDAAQLLKALERQEADTQDKVQKQKAKATRSKSRTNKDW